MYNDQDYPPECTNDPLDEFLAQLLNDIPDVLPAPVTPSAATAAPSVALSPVPVPTSSQSSSTPVLHVPTAIATATTPYYTAASSLTCQWVTAHDLPLVCGAALSPDPKTACTHFRHVHHVRGNEKVTVQCHWRDCPVAPMQRGSLIRHILTVHLGLLRWRCETCGKTFSRRGTTHACVEDS